MNFLRFIAAALLVSSACTQLLPKMGRQRKNTSMHNESVENFFNKFEELSNACENSKVSSKDFAQQPIGKQSANVSTEQGESLVAHVQELCKKSTDFVGGLRKEFNQKFTELSPDHQYYCVLAAQGIIGFVIIGGICYAVYKTGLVAKIKQSVTIGNPTLVVTTGALTSTISGIALLDYCKPELTSALVATTKTLLADASSWIAQRAGAVAGQLPALSTMKNMAPSLNVVYGVGALVAVGLLGVAAYKYRANVIATNKRVAQKEDQKLQLQDLLFDANSDESDKSLALEHVAIFNDDKLTELVCDWYNSNDTVKAEEQRQIILDYLPLV